MTEAHYHAQQAIADTTTLHGLSSAMLERVASHLRTMYGGQKEELPHFSRLKTVEHAIAVILKIRHSKEFQEPLPIARVSPPAPPVPNQGWKPRLKSTVRA